MLNLCKLLTLLTAALVGPVMADMEKRAPGNWQLHPFGNTFDRCLGVPADSLVNGGSLSVQPCSTPRVYTVFAFEREQPGLVRLAGTDFCLDAGLGLNEFKIWTCLPNVPQQQWFYTADNHLSIYNGPGRCATYAGGGCSRIYCFPGVVSCTSDTYQQWVLTEADPPSTPPTLAFTINNGGKCLTTNGPDVWTQVDGTPVIFSDCLPGSRFFGNQLWEVPAKNSFGRIKMRNKDLCLDAGNTPLQNGRGLKLWTCYANLYQQTFYRTEDDHLAIYNDVQCVDVKREDGVSVQTWQCAGGNPQQIFTTTAY